MKKVIFFICFVICLLGGELVAQDGLFSQFLNNKSLLNPSTFSLQNDPIVFQLQYREQGASVSDGLPLRTFLANFNYATPSLGKDRMSFGLTMTGDKGGLGHLSKTLAHLNFSYLKRLSGTYSNSGIHFFGIGIQAGGGQHSVQWNRFWFGNQYDRGNGIVNTSLESGEPEIEMSSRGTSSVFYDINAGLNWYSMINESLSFYAGYALFHLNRPNISLFENGNERLSIRNSFHVGMVKVFQGGFQFKPQAFYSRQGKASQLIIGSEIGINNEDVLELLMDFGIYTRLISNYDQSGMDAIILSLNLAYEQFKFGIAYDITVSRLSKYNGSKGAWELMMNYSIPAKQKTYYRSKIPSKM